MKKDEKTQLNTRVWVEYADTLRQIDEKLKFPQRQVVEDALALLFGEKDEVAEARCKRIRTALKKGEIKSPFEYGAVAA